MNLYLIDRLVYNFAILFKHLQWDLLCTYLSKLTDIYLQRYISLNRPNLSCRCRSIERSQNICLWSSETLSKRLTDSSILSSLYSTQPPRREFKPPRNQDIRLCEDQTHSSQRPPFHLHVWRSFFLSFFTSFFLSFFLSLLLSFFFLLSFFLSFRLHSLSVTFHSLYFFLSLFHTHTHFLSLSPSHSLTHSLTIYIYIYIYISFKFFLFVSPLQCLLVVPPTLSLSCTLAR